MELFWVVLGIFTAWMCVDCINRREHFIWVIIMIVLFPLGAFIYFFAIKNKSEGPRQAPIKLFQSGPPREVETEETLQLKELISKYNKAYHYNKLGQIYLEQKKSELAIPLFEEAVQRDPELNEARYGLAKALHAQGQPAEAAKILEELIKIDKKYDYGNAIFGLAECYRLSGQEEKALEAYEAVINSFHFFKAYYHYARLLDKKGKKKEAIDYMKSIIGSSKDLPEYKLEKERHWIEEAYKYLRKNGIELA
ncbi:MAG: tetratricopeptide repeat protein [Nitrospinaceae bacterium]|nr:tetratricopeptide repeat protein [Nitrospinaceae bacterium]NIR56149.1 tetratricopeptide repeat protein [Nitrospinaceae bacterium]NIS86604.1 tetratricopeptide repeat protein [Nitrospinaceae bacterium]NIT83434.1 tetratricopeptide repeat protein [Nitrospinaceae bacterium]NIU45643.1 tetratricopeptide repeat protein [Nitrospinaceae bacterium]